jgi:hypothetical protein
MSLIASNCPSSGLLGTSNLDLGIRWGYELSLHGLRQRYCQAFEAETDAEQLLQGVSKHSSVREVQASRELVQHKNESA